MYVNIVMFPALLLFISSLLDFCIILHHRLFMHHHIYILGIFGGLSSAYNVLWYPEIYGQLPPTLRVEPTEKDEAICVYHLQPDWSLLH